MITIRELTVRYDGHTVFDRFQADLPLSGNTVLRGASGAGKTTLLRVLMGLVKADSGRISGLEGKTVSAVFQEDRLLPWYTALENVALVADIARAREYLCALGLADFLDARPGALSGGMKRRVAIARALAYGGDLLLLDEPFTGLDESAKTAAARLLIDSGVPLIAALHSDAEMALLHPATVISI